jgi:hypothetical protein
MKQYHFGTHQTKVVDSLLSSEIRPTGVGLSLFIRRPVQFMSAESSNLTLLDDEEDTKTLKVIGWVSVGMAVAAVGLYVGSELRSRYKFKRRTPYDFYSSAGNQQSTEFGVGI